MTPVYGFSNSFYPNNAYNPNNSGLGNPEAAFYQGMSIINSGQPCYDTFGYSSMPTYNSNSFMNTCRYNMGQAMYNFNSQANQQMQMLKVYMALMMAQIYLSASQASNDIRQNNNFNTLLNSIPGFNNSNYVSGNSNAQPLSESEMRVTTPSGSNLAKEAYKTASSMQANGSKGYCFRGVKNSLRKVGVNLQGGSAYMAADQLARNDKFQEANVPKGNLKSLPAGAIVVWDKCPGHPHGHISVALGNGKEASDHVQNQIQNYGPRYRVFMPKA